jgi:hypothetical protein
MPRSTLGARRDQSTRSEAPSRMRGHRAAILPPTWSNRRLAALALAASTAPGVRLEPRARHSASCSPSPERRARSSAAPDDRLGAAGDRRRIALFIGSPASAGASTCSSPQSRPRRPLPATAFGSTPRRPFALGLPRARSLTLQASSRSPRAACSTGRGGGYFSLLALSGAVLSPLSRWRPRRWPSRRGSRTGGADPAFLAAASCFEASGGVTAALLPAAMAWVLRHPQRGTCAAANVRYDRGLELASSGAGNRVHFSAQCAQPQRGECARRQVGSTSANAG